MNEIWIAKASTAWRGWSDDQIDPVPDHCIEIGFAECHSGTYDILKATDDPNEIAHTLLWGINYAAQLELPVAWSFQDLVYSEPWTDYDELVQRAFVVSDRIIAEHFGDDWQDTEWEDEDD